MSPVRFESKSPYDHGESGHTRNNETIDLIGDPEGRLEFTKDRNVSYMGKDTRKLGKKV